MTTRQQSPRGKTGILYSLSDAEKKLRLHVASEAAQVGKFTRLKEETVESSREFEEEIDHEWNSRKGLAQFNLFRSNFFQVIHEAAAMGRMKTGKGHVVTSYNEQEEGEAHEQATRTLPTDSQTISRLLEEKVPIKQVINTLVDDYLEHQREIKLEGLLSPEAQMERLEDLNASRTGLALLSPVPPSKTWSKRKSMAEKLTFSPLDMSPPQMGTGALTPNQILRQKVSQEAALSVNEREKRILQCQTLRVTSKCTCGYCANPSPYQTHFYKQLERLGSDHQEEAVRVAQELGAPSLPLSSPVHSPANEGHDPDSDHDQWTDVLNDASDHRSLHADHQSFYQDDDKSAANTMPSLANMSDSDGSFVSANLNLWGSSNHMGTGWSSRFSSSDSQLSGLEEESVEGESLDVLQPSISIKKPTSHPSLAVKSPPSNIVPVLNKGDSMPRTPRRQNSNLCSESPQGNLNRESKQPRKLPTADIPLFESDKAELEYLKEKQESGEPVNERRLYELQLFDWHENGWALTEEELNDLESFREMRRLGQHEATEEPTLTRRSYSSKSSGPLDNTMHDEDSNETGTPKNTLAQDASSYSSGNESDPDDDSTDGMNSFQMSESTFGETTIHSTEQQRVLSQFLKSQIEEMKLEDEDIISRATMKTDVLLTKGARTDADDDYDNTIHSRNTRTGRDKHRNSEAGDSLAEAESSSESTHASIPKTTSTSNNQAIANKPLSDAADATNVSNSTPDIPANHSLSSGSYERRRIEEEELDELNDLYDLRDRGEDIDENRLYELELFDRYRQGEILSQSEQDDLEFYKRRRKRIERHVDEFNKLCDLQDAGEEVDLHRMHFLELVVRDRLGEELTHEEFQDLEDFDAEEEERELDLCRSSPNKNSTPFAADKHTTHFIRESNHGRSHIQDRSEDSSLSSWEVDELNEMLDSAEQGGTVNKQKMRELDIFDRWKNGETLDALDNFELQIYRKKRRRERRYRREFQELLEWKEMGQEVDENRMNCLALFARHSIGQELDEDELATLDQFMRREKSLESALASRASGNKKAESPPPTDPVEKSIVLGEEDANVVESPPPATGGEVPVDSNVGQSEMDDGLGDDSDEVGDQASMDSSVAELSKDSNGESAESTEEVKVASGGSDEGSSEGSEANAADEGVDMVGKEAGSADPVSGFDEGGSMDDQVALLHLRVGSQDSAPASIVRVDESAMNSQDKCSSARLSAGNDEPSTASDDSYGFNVVVDKESNPLIVDSPSREGVTRHESQPPQLDRGGLSESERFELSSLSRRDENGEKVNKEKLFKLELMRKWEKGAVLREDEKVELEDFLRCREKARLYRCEYQELICDRENGTEIDKERLLCLSLYAKRHAGLALDADDLAVLASFDAMEQLMEQRLQQTATIHHVDSHQAMNVGVGVSLEAKAHIQGSRSSEDLERNDGDNAGSRNSELARKKARLEKIRSKGGHRSSADHLRSDRSDNKDLKESHFKKESPTRWRLLASTSPKLDWRSDPDDSFSDWSIHVRAVGSKTTVRYHVHRNVVGYGPRKSDYLARKFKEYVDGSEPVSRFILPIVEMQVLPMVLDYLYLSKNVTQTMSIENACAMYCLAERLEMPTLQTALAEFYRKNIKITNMARFLRVATSCNAERLAFVAKARIGSMVTEKPSLARLLKPSFLTELGIILQTHRQLVMRHFHIQNPSDFFALEVLQSRKWSCAIYHCSLAKDNTFSKDLFQQASSEKVLPAIDASMAIVFLRFNLLHNADEGDRVEYESLRHRCLSAIGENTEAFSNSFESEKAMLDQIDMLPKELLVQILSLLRDQAVSTNITR